MARMEWADAQNFFFIDSKFIFFGTVLSDEGCGMSTYDAVEMASGLGWNR